MFQDSKQALIDLLNREWWATLLSKSFKRAVAITGLFFIYCLFSLSYERRSRHLAIQRTEKLLEQRDAPNQIPDAPLKIRELPSGVKRIDLDQIRCETCNRMVANIVFFPCQHCFKCQECYRGEQNRFKCGKCQKTIHQYLQVHY